MPAITDTFHLAYNCCDEVFLKTGRFPTIEAVREVIGINSPNTIRKAINQWTADFVQKHYEKLSRPGLPPLLIDAAESIWSVALREAQKIHESDKQQFERNIELLQSELSSARTSFEAQLSITQDLESELAIANDRAESLSTKLALAEGSNEALLRDVESNSVLTGALKQQVDGLTAAMDAEKQRHAQDKEEALRFKEDNWQLRFSEQLSQYQEKEAECKDLAHALQWANNKIYELGVEIKQLREALSKATAQANIKDRIKNHKKR